MITAKISRVIGWVFLLIIIAPALKAETVVAVTYPPFQEQKQVWRLAQEARLSQIIDLAALPHDKIYWPSARLTSNIKSHEIEQRRKKLVGLINEYATFMERRNNFDYSRQVREFARAVSNIQLLPTYLWGIDYGQLKSRVDVNPFLKHQNERDIASRFILSFRKPPELQCVLGVGVRWECFMVEEGESLRLLLKQKNLLSLVKDGKVWLAQYNGRIREVPVAYYNALEVPQRVGNIVLLGLTMNNVPDKFNAINRKLAELLTHACLTDCQEVIP